MYKTAVISGGSSNISTALKMTIDSINTSQGKITHIVQSQSTTDVGIIIVTITIVYLVEKGFW
jgi:hypothetical protein